MNKNKSVFKRIAAMASALMIGTGLLVGCAVPAGTVTANAEPAPVQSADEAGAAQVDRSQTVEPFLETL